MRDGEPRLVLELSLNDFIGMGRKQRNRINQLFYMNDQKKKKIKEGNILYIGN